MQVTQRWVSTLEQFKTDDADRFHRWAKEKCIDFPEAQTNISAVTLQDTMGSNTQVVNYDLEVLESTDITI